MLSAMRTHLVAQGSRLLQIYVGELPEAVLRGDPPGEAGRDRVDVAVSWDEAGSLIGPRRRIETPDRPRRYITSACFGIFVESLPLCRLGEARL